MNSVSLSLVEVATEEASSEGVKAVFSEAEAGASGETACAVPSAKALKRDSGARRDGGLAERVS